ncbi:hypothetical protein MOF05_06965 [Bacillus haynesii]|uniref:hypothetical protein n=1 Tax=Bacillus haynesii TaxID=1925021 RepID=UPI0022814671|nr:hypothetical protein [Bacillus haynesii]MCY9215811.1 hypothetical protein [Bacillus haynesii]MCY9288132.1 hypothetical protein [Bacillus haynesii]
MIPTMTLIREDDIKFIKNSENLSELIKNLNVEMTLKVNNESNSHLFKAFCYQKTKNPESSRLDFFHIDQFPDGVFLKEGEDGTYHCYIFELKHTGSNDLKKLTKQLFSGYIHCKSLLSVLDIDLNKVTYSFHVVFVKENSNQDKFNKKNRAKKVIPGKKINSSSAFDNWLNNILIYSAGEYKKVMEIDKIALNFTKQRENIAQYYNTFIV